MIEFDNEFFDADKIVFETVDDVDEYITTVDVWLAMHDESAKDVTGSEKVGFYELHVFDEPVQIVTPDGDLLDSFSAAVVYDSPGKLGERETSAFTFDSEEAARMFFEARKEELFEASMQEEGEELVDLGELKGEIKI